MKEYKIKIEAKFGSKFQEECFDGILKNTIQAINKK